MVHPLSRVLTDALIIKPLSIDWSVAGTTIPAITFTSRARLTTPELAFMLGSLVRVSTRVGRNHLINSSISKLGWGDRLGTRKVSKSIADS